MTLPLVLLKSVKAPFLAAILPRLFLIMFRYSQPNLIKQSIKYVSTYSYPTEKEYGYSLVVSAVVVYVGLAVSFVSQSSPELANVRLRYPQPYINIL